MKKQALYGIREWLVFISHILIEKIRGHRAMLAGVHIVW